jgi:hypothetical protein
MCRCELTNVWHQLDSLEPPYYRICPCCVLRQRHNTVLCLHEFLRRLRLEFEQLRAQLLARSPLPPLVDEVTLARAEEISLRGVLPSSSTVLAAQTASPTSAPTLAPVAVPLAQEGVVVAVSCRYCKAMTHTIEKCRCHPPHRRGGAPTPAVSTTPQSPTGPSTGVWSTWCAFVLLR